VIRRARPLLGTIVAIAADAAPAAIEAAFAAIARVHACMSAQRADSDIGRINRDAHRHPVAVDPWTFEVLQRALELSEATAGAFDVVVPGDRARHADIVLESGAVRLRRPARLDVSGIAKGFAVDVAVEVLQRRGASAGSVNAGGDLRFLGDEQQVVNVRVPGQPAQSVQLPPLPYPAYATSSGEFGATLYDPRNGASSAMDWSVTVAATTCLMADALTKVTALLGPVRSLLKRFDAAAFALDANGRLHAPAG
jgi:thiamine biosynthesis lipoprotein